MCYPNSGAIEPRPKIRADSTAVHRSTTWRAYANSLKTDEIPVISGKWLDPFVDHMGKGPRCVIIERGRERGAGLGWNAFIVLACPGGFAEETGGRSRVFCAWDG